MPDDAASLLAYLADRDVACPGCGYNLRGLLRQACPECNQDLRLTVGLVEPRLGLWLAAVIGAAVGLGLNLLLLIYLAIVLLRESGIGAFMWAFLIHNAVGLVVQGLLLLALLKWGRRIRRWPAKLRAATVLFAWGVSLINVYVFSMLVR